MRSQRHKVEYYGYASNGEAAAQGVIGPQDLGPAVIVSIAPDTAVAESHPGIELTVTGSGFTPGCVVLVDATEVDTTFVSDTELTAIIPQDVFPEGGGVWPVVVRKNGVDSNIENFTWTAP